MQIRLHPPFGRVEQLASGESVVVVIAIIPIVVGTPAVLIFVPPAMAVIPAVGARLCEFIAPMLGL